MTRQVEAMSGAGVGVVELPEPEVESRAHPVTGDPASDWLCAWCLNRVASDRDRFSIAGRSEFTFSNPAGIRFDILIFSRTLGCRSSGVPTFEHTWFPGHAWSYCVCDRCGLHVGWYYTGPGEFAGLIRDRIVRAMLIMN